MKGLSLPRPAVHPPGEPAGARSCVRTSRPGRNKCSPVGCCRNKSPAPRISHSTGDLLVPIRAARSSPSRWRRGPPGRSTWPSANAPAGRCSWPPTGGGWTGTAPGGSSARPHAAQGSPRPSPRTRSDTRHRRARRRSASARRPRSRLACRSENHHAVRPGPGQPGPARHLYRRRVYRRSRPVTDPTRTVPPGGCSCSAELFSTAGPIAARWRRAATSR